jgi:hypothetical protein
MAYLIRTAFHSFGGRMRGHERRMPLELDDHTLRDIGITRVEYQFRLMSDPSSVPDAGGGEH